MRTNIDINDDLIAKAMKISRLSTKKDVVDLALQEYVTNHTRLNLMDLKGKVKFADGYDHRKLREGRLVDFS